MQLMHEKKKSIILEKLISIYNKTRQESTSAIRIDMRDDEYIAILNQFLKEKGWRAMFTEKFIVEKINSVILKMIKDGTEDKAKDHLDEMIKELESFSTKQMTVYIPIHGIEKPITKIQIGNITLRCLDDTEIEALIEKVEKDSIEIEQINKHIRGHICAEYCAIAEPDRALELAEEETRRAIDLIRYANLVLYNQTMRVAVGMSGDICSSWRYAVIHPMDTRSFSSRKTLIGPLYEFEFSDENIETMEKIGVFKLSEVLQKDELNPFEVDLLSSVHWFANSQTKLERADKLLNLITSLEILFTPNSGDPISQNIAESTAILIVDDPVERKKIIKIIRDLYALRSKLSHHGKGEVLDSHIQYLIKINCIVLTILVSRITEFETKDELHKWIEYKKLGGLPENWTQYCDSI
jgi:hypothetical protein